MVKDFNVITDKLAFFDLPIKTEEKAYVFIIIEKKEHTISEFPQNFANVLYE